MSGDSKAGKVWRPLAADIRQAIVGWVVLLAIPLAGALALTVLVGSVPAWTLALVVAVSVLLVAAVSLEHRRELGRVEGSLSAERERREEAEAKLACVPDQSADGEPMVTAAQRGLLFRVQALRGELETRRVDWTTTTTSQDQAIRNLAIDVRNHIGRTDTLDGIIEEWSGFEPDRQVVDAITGLGQLEGILIGFEGSTPSNATS